MPLRAKDTPTNRIEASHTVLNELTQALGAMGVLPHFRPSRTAAGVPTDLVTAADASSLATSQTLAAAVATALTAHGADTEAHSSADTIAIAAWASAPAVPANITEVQNVLNEVKADFNTHIALATKHRGVGAVAGAATVGLITTTDAVDQSTANALANAIKAALNRHARAGAQNIVVVPS